MQQDTLYFIDSKTLLTYQNRALFCVSILSTGVCVYYNYTKSPVSFDYILNIITLYSFVDLFFSEDIASKMHHLTLINMFIYKRLTNLDPIDCAFVYYTLCKTEFSSIFLVLKYWLDKKTVIYKVNLVVFYVLFLKMRVIDFYSVISHGSPIYMIDEKYSKNTCMSLMFLSSMYGLYALNIYWFIQMNMILYTQLFVKNKKIKD